MSIPPLYKGVRRVHEPLVCVPKEIRWKHDVSKLLSKDRTPVWPFASIMALPAFDRRAIEVSEADPAKLTCLFCGLEYKAFLVTDVVGGVTLVCMCIVAFR